MTRPLAMPLPLPILVKLMGWVFVLASIYTTWQSSLSTMSAELNKQGARITVMESCIADQASSISRIDERTRLTLQILNPGAHVK